MTPRFRRLSFCHGRCCVEGLRSDHWALRPRLAFRLVGEFRDYYGPTVNSFAAAAADDREAELQAELEALFNEQNTSDAATSIPATFLRVQR